MHLDSNAPVAEKDHQCHVHYGACKCSAAGNDHD